MTDANRTPPPSPDDTGEHAAIPILMEPLPEVAGNGDVPAAHVLGRADQQSLFDEPEPPVPPRPRPAARRSAPGPEHLRAAGHLLRARAPAILDELVQANAERLTAELRERLARELDSLLAELTGSAPAAGDPPAGD